MKLQYDELHSNFAFNFNLRRYNTADVRRIERLEIFDELEEWHLIQAHYCIAWGVGPGRILSTLRFKLSVMAPGLPYSSREAQRLSAERLRD